MSPLSALVCGYPKGSSRLAESLRHLAATLSTLEVGIRGALINPRPVDRLTIPFFTRSVVEVASTAIIGRLDAFRLLTLAEVQTQGTFVPGTRAGSAIQWTGDVLSPDGQVKSIWEQSRKFADMSRALLGDYQDQVFWRPAFESFLDFMAEQSPQAERSPWIQELLDMVPESVVPRLRGTATALYHSTSKGVHHEFVLTPSAYYDDATLNELADGAIKLTATMGLISNFGVVSAFRPSPARALERYEAIAR